MSATPSRPSFREMPRIGDQIDEQIAGGLFRLHRGRCLHQRRGLEVDPIIATELTEAQREDLARRPHERGWTAGTGIWTSYD